MCLLSCVSSWCYTVKNVLYSIKEKKMVPITFSFKKVLKQKKKPLEKYENYTLDLILI